MNKSKPEESKESINVAEEEVYKKDDDKYDFKKFQKEKWVTGEMGKQFQRDIFLVVHARETVFYLIFVVCVTVSALGLVDSRMFFMTQSLRNHLKEQAGFENPTLDHTSEVKFDDISTVTEMWDYIENHFVQYLHARNGPGLAKKEEDIWENETVSTTPPPRQRRQVSGQNDTDVDEDSSGDFDDRGLGYENILIGRGVIRAVMVNDIQCPAPFPAVFIRCYPPYTRKRRKRNVSEGLYPYMEQVDTQATSFTGKVAHYQADGFQEKLGPTYQDSLQTVKRLKKERFITKNTRAVFIDAAYYNPSVNLFCSVKLLFELPPGGGVVPSAYFYTLSLTRRVTVGDYVTLAFEILFVLFIVFFFIEEIRSIAFVRMQYFHSFWNWISMGIMAISVVFFILLVLQHKEVSWVLRSMRVDINDYISFQTVTKKELILRNVLAACIFMVYLKIFKYMSFNWTMTILNKTMKRCLQDIFGFILMFLVMFMAFALFGALCFGTQMRHFSVIPLAMFALLRTMLGDFEYTEFQDADKDIAPYYYLLYIFLVFFILLNMFLAIINDTYSDAKTELAISVPERRVSDFWNTGLYNLMRECGCKGCAPKKLVQSSHINPSAEEIRAALKRCGYSDLDIDLFLGRYNIDPEAQVRVKDVTTVIERIRFQGARRTSLLKKKTVSTIPSPIIALDDFTQQQERLEQVEAVMKTLVLKLDALLEKLLEFDKRKKSRQPPPKDKEK